MTAPRLEIDSGKVEENTRVLVRQLARRGIEVMGVTKAALGSPEVGAAMLRGGATSLGDSRIENIERTRRSQVPSLLTLIRTPMISQVDRVVEQADVSVNSELAVIAALALVAQRCGRTHGIVLMVELGDLREGLMPEDLEDAVRQLRRLPNVVLKGIGANFACRSGVIPSSRSMGELSELATSVEATFGMTLDVVSGGSSANLDWVLNAHDVGRINELRLGESILLGCEPLERRPIPGLYTDAFTLVAEVIESRLKPSIPWGEVGQAAFGPQPPAQDRGLIQQTILAIGRQDVDPDGLCAPPGFEILGTSSDHLVVEASGQHLPVGAEVRFQVNYSALLSAMTSPFVVKVVVDEREHPPVRRLLPMGQRVITATVGPDERRRPRGRSEASEPAGALPVQS